MRTTNIHSGVFYYVYYAVVELNRIELHILLHFSVCVFAIS